MMIEHVKIEFAYILLTFEYIRLIWSRVEYVQTDWIFSP